ncbi:MAG: PEP-CTERM sorting domain-containing protein, partial [Pseudomonadota bacterium]
MIGFARSVAVCAALLSPTAGAVTLDFESLASEFSVGVGRTYSEDGFTLSVVGGGGAGFVVMGQNQAPYTGSTALYLNLLNITAVLTQDDGASFSISEIKLSPLNGIAVTVSFLGTLSDGGTVSQAFTTADGFTLQTFEFDPSFTDLVTLEWDQVSPAHQFDDLVVTSDVAAVPLPPTLLLLLGGLG